MFDVPACSCHTRLASAEAVLDSLNYDIEALEAQGLQVVNL
jgi:hypothetical protein